MRVALILATAVAAVTVVGALIAGSLGGGSADPASVANTAPARAAPILLPPTVGPGGAGADLTAPAPTAPPPLPAVVPVAAVRRAAPNRLVIPRIRVDAPLRGVGVDKTGQIEVPPLSELNLAGWYTFGPTPGEMGPAVIVGHVSTRKGPAVFARLSELRRGDTIKVGRSDGSVVAFIVDGVEQAPKSTFPTARVYGNTTNAALRLITCGGVYNKKAHSYTDNLIVYGTLSATKAA
jgi:hypothetical protein